MKRGGDITEQLYLRGRQGAKKGNSVMADREIRCWARRSILGVTEKRIF